MEPMTLERATPSPAPEVVSIEDTAEASAEPGREYALTVLSPNDGTVQEDGTIRTQNGDVISLLPTAYLPPTPKIALSPTPVPTSSSPKPCATSVSSRSSAQPSTSRCWRI